MVMGVSSLLLLIGTIGSAPRCPPCQRSRRLLLQHPGWLYRLTFSGAVALLGAIFSFVGWGMAAGDTPGTGVATSLLTLIVVLTLVVLTLLFGVVMFMGLVIIAGAAAGAANQGRRPRARPYGGGNRSWAPYKSSIAPRLAPGLRPGHGSSRVPGGSQDAVGRVAPAPALIRDAALGSGSWVSGSASSLTVRVSARTANASR